MTEYTRPATRDDLKAAIRINDEFTIDVMPSIAGLSWDDMRTHITTMTIDEVQIRVLDVEGVDKAGCAP